jgi:hypothetical protein
MTGPVVDRLLRPFFSGVVLEEELTTSSRFVDLMLRMFVRGSSVVPGSGMQQIAEQIAARLPAGSIHINLPVRKADARRSARTPAPSNPARWSWRPMRTAPTSCSVVRRGATSGRA